MKINDIKQYLDNEQESWNDISVLRESFQPALFDKVNVASKLHARERAVDTIQNVLTICKESGLKYSNMDPGHGVGHLVRYYVNAQILAGTESNE